MFTSRYMPCSQCGASVERGAAATHQCEMERRLDYQMFGLREEIAALETGFQDHLDTPAGRFQVWLAARQVRS